jgi:hypothetical protein
MTNGRRSRLIWPARTHDERTVWLSSGQRSLLFYLRAEMGHGRHAFSHEQLSKAAGIHPSNVTRGLDRLASLGVIGRRSSRGCLGRTIVWDRRHRAATRRPANRRANVATSTPYGGFITRERWRSLVAAGDDRAVRRLTPPRTLYGRCAAGHRARLTRWAFRRWPGANRTELRTFEGVWVGDCRRCGERVRLTDRITVPAPAGGQSWQRAGTIAGQIVGGFD